jgi:L-arabinokinase
MVARRGTSRRIEIAQAYGLDPRRRWLLLYLGNLGTALDLQTLRNFNDSVFLMFSQTDKTAPANLVSLEQGRFRHQDVVASVDGVLAKPGYGMVGECMANGAPLLYAEREHFAEYEALDRALQNWGGAIRLSQADFAAGHWAQALARLATLRPQPLENLNGAEVIARELAVWVERTQNNER